MRKKTHVLLLQSNSLSSNPEPVSKVTNLLQELFKCFGQNVLFRHLGGASCASLCGISPVHGDLWSDKLCNSSTEPNTLLLCKERVCIYKY